MCVEEPLGKGNNEQEAFGHVAYKVLGTASRKGVMAATTIYYHSAMLQDKAEL